MDVISGRNSPFKMLEENRKMIDLMTGRNSPLRIYEDNRKMIDVISGRNSPLRVYDQNRKIIDLISGENSPFKMLAASRTLLDSISAKPAYASAIGLQQPLAQILAQPSFASMIGTTAFPRPAWIGVLDGLRDFVPDDLYDETVAEFEAIADAIAEGDGETWWIARLSTVVQLRLLTMVLGVIHVTGGFVYDVVNGEAQPAIRSGTGALVLLAATIIAFIEAKAKLMQEEKDSD